MLRSNRDEAIEPPIPGHVPALIANRTNPPESPGSDTRIFNHGPLQRAARNALEWNLSTVKLPGSVQSKCDAQYSALCSQEAHPASERLGIIPAIVAFRRNHTNRGLCFRHMEAIETLIVAFAPFQASI